MLPPSIYHGRGDAVVDHSKHGLSDRVLDSAIFTDVAQASLVQAGQMLDGACHRVWYSREWASPHCGRLSRRMEGFDLPSECQRGAWKTGS